MILPSGYKFYHIDTCPSTMDYCAQLIQQNGQDRTVTVIIQSNAQTQGRGQRGRSWQSLKGNLFMSLGLWLSDISLAPQYSFLTAVAVGETLMQFAPNLDLYYKWPNDFMVGDKKIGGVLVETKGVKSPLIIGVGLNLVARPDLKGYESIDLKALNVYISIQEFIPRLIKSFDHYKRVINKDGFSIIRTHWLKKAWRRGQEITVKTADGATTKGFFHGINQQGGLVLKNKNKETILYTAQIIR